MRLTGALGDFDRTRALLDGRVKAEGFEIEILGRRHGARMATAPLFDPSQERLRG